MNEYLMELPTRETKKKEMKAQQLIHNIHLKEPTLSQLTHK